MSYFNPSHVVEIINLSSFDLGLDSSLLDNVNFDFCSPPLGPCEFYICQKMINKLIIANEYRKLLRFPSINCFLYPSGPLLYQNYRHIVLWTSQTFWSCHWSFPLAHILLQTPLNMLLLEFLNRDAMEFIPILNSIISIFRLSYKKIIPCNPLGDFW